MNARSLCEGGSPFLGKSKEGTQDRKHQRKTKTDFFFFRWNFLSIKGVIIVITYHVMICRGRRSFTMHSRGVKRETSSNDQRPSHHQDSQQQRVNWLSWPQSVSLLVRLPNNDLHENRTTTKAIIWWKQKMQTQQQQNNDNKRRRRW